MAFTFRLCSCSSLTTQFFSDKSQKLTMEQLNWQQWDFLSRTRVGMSPLRIGGGSLANARDRRGVGETMDYAWQHGQLISTLRCCVPPGRTKLAWVLAVRRTTQLVRFSTLRKRSFARKSPPGTRLAGLGERHQRDAVSQTQRSYSCPTQAH